MERLDALLARLEKPFRARNIWKAKCPAHSDKSPSLAIRVDNIGNILLYCFAGCTVAEVMAAVGLPVYHLFSPRIVPSSPPKPQKKTETVLAEHRRKLSDLTASIRRHPGLLDVVRDEAMDVACDYWATAEQYNAEGISRSNEESPPHCWWVCSYDCEWRYGHEEECDGCRKTGFKEYHGLCKDHFTYGEPDPGGVGDCSS